MGSTYLQSGTGLHVDTNGHNPYVEEQDEEGKMPFKPLEKWYPYQGLVALSDGDNNVKDGSLEVLPGFHVVCEAFFNAQGRFGEGLGSVEISPTVLGRDMKRWGPYITKFFPQYHQDLISMVLKVNRIPDDWDVSKVKEYPVESIKKLKTVDEIKEYLKEINQELKNFQMGGALQAGDYVLWDNRLPHQSSGKNETNVIRRVIYVTYLPGVK